MNAHNKVLIFVGASILISGCASTINGKITRNTLLAGALGAAYGNSREEYKTTHAAMYGAIGAFMGAISSVYYYDPEKENQALRNETATLKEKLDQLEKPTLLDQGNSLFKSQIPSSLTKFIQPGEWKHYRLNQWVQDANNTNIWIKQTEMYEIIPPTSGN